MIQKNPIPVDCFRFKARKGRIRAGPVQRESWTKPWTTGETLSGQGIWPVQAALSSGPDHLLRSQVRKACHAIACQLASQGMPKQGKRQGFAWCGMQLGKAWLASGLPGPLRRATVRTGELASAAPAFHHQTGPGATSPAQALVKGCPPQAQPLG